jgi:hypothetical protein
VHQRLDRDLSTKATGNSLSCSALYSGTGEESGLGFYGYPVGFGAAASAFSCPLFPSRPVVPASSCS